LELGVTTQTRDAVLGQTESFNLPKNEVFREWQMERYERALELGKPDSTLAALPYGKSPSSLIQKLVQKGVVTSLSAVCAFFVKGKCNRGEECQYKHEIPEIAQTQPLEKVYPVPPANRSLSSLLITGIDEPIAEDVIRRKMEEFGLVNSIKMMLNSSSALVEYKLRSSAEAAVKSLWGTLELNGLQLRVEWSNVPGDSSPSDQVVSEKKGKTLIDEIAQSEDGFVNRDAYKHMQKKSEVLSSMSVFIPPPPGIKVKSLTGLSQTNQS